MSKTTTENLEQDQSGLLPEEKIPHAVFSLSEITPNERYAFWKESISFIFDVEAEKDIRDGPFEARIEASVFGQIILARTSTQQQSWIRTERNIARDNMDHYMIQLYETGGMWFEHAGEQLQVPHTGLIVYDLSRTSHTRTGNFTNQSMIVPRALLEPHLNFPDQQHMRRLTSDQPLVQLLHDHIRSLNDLSSQITLAQAVEVNPATVALIAACLNSTPDGNLVQDHSTETALMMLTKKIIDVNLYDPALSVEMLMRLVNVSRYKLYGMFRAAGGVQAFVLERRLKRAMVMLLDPANHHQSISDVAFSCGFPGDSSFSRSFKKRFGMSPRDAKLTEMNGKSDRRNFTGTDTRYENWIRDL
ncbi:MAG: helix-turn-helix domain-containing protein [Cohaesibacteraceae bacterium]|nr:helix-turn-helix domain-containing protein [Cohaesibacteraceae bacterium]